MATTLLQETTAVPLEKYELDTLTKLFYGSVEKYDRPDAMMARVDGRWQEISHREIAEKVEQIAAGLSERGVVKGDRVAILSENRPEWAMTDFAVLSLAAADVSLYANLPPNQIAFILNDAGAKAIFVSNREQLDKILEIRADVPTLETIIAFDVPSDAQEGVTGLTDFLDTGQKQIQSGDFPDFPTRTAAIQPDDLATLIYTSGTTGDPKGVMLTHENLASNVAASHQHGIFDLRPGMIALSFLPLSHVFERMVDYLFWSSGTSLAYVSSMDRIAESMLEVRPHVMAAAPRVFEKIYTRVMGATGIKALLVKWATGVGANSVGSRLEGSQSEPSGWAEKLADRLVFSKLRERTGGRVEAFVSGSAPLSEEIAHFFWSAGMPIYEGYGLTETSPVISVNRPGKVRLGTVGPLLPGTEVRIADEGEIQVRGPQVMLGYYKKPDATRASMTEDGWFRTGDIGEIDDGMLRITDRLKNIIVTAGGKNVAPAPIESAASMSPFVSQVIMIGDKRPFPSLLVVPDFENLVPWAKKNGISTDDQAALSRDPKVHELLKAETLGKLTGFARYELPKKIGVLPNELSVEGGELTAKLSVKRRVVEERYADIVEEIYDV